MLRVCVCVMLWFAVCGSTAVCASAAEWGDLTGRFVYDGIAPEPSPLKIEKDVEVFGNKGLVDESLVVGDDGGVANVVIYCRGIVESGDHLNSKPPIHPDRAAVPDAALRLTNHDGRFQPHVLAIRIGQVLELRNADPVSHNTNLSPIGDMGINPLLPSMGKHDFKFNRAQNIPVPVNCNLHPWMTAYVIPRDNPYVAVSGPDGRFTMEKLPAGELEFGTWHERQGYLKAWPKGRFRLTIESGKNDMGTIKLKPEWLSPRS